MGQVLYLSCTVTHSTLPFLVANANSLGVSTKLHEQGEHNLILDWNGENNLQIIKSSVKLPIGKRNYKKPVSYLSQRKLRPIHEPNLDLD